MEANALVHLTPQAASVYEGKPVLGEEIRTYEVMLQRIEPQYIVLRVARPEDEGAYNLLYFPWTHIIGVELPEGISHHLIRKAP